VGAVDAEALAELRVPDLKDKCRAMGLPVGGTKAVLIERICDADGAPEAETADAADADAAAIDDDCIEHPAELEATATLKPKPGFRAGFVGVVGSPNVGKSTITNALLGENLCVTTSKAQTTRHRILSVVTSESHQLILSDTPGILERPAYELQERMMVAARAATRDAECVLFVTDIFQDEAEIRDAYEWMAEPLPAQRPPVVVALNKVDLLQDGKLGDRAEQRVGSLAACLERVAAACPSAVEVVPVSGLEQEVDDLARALAAQLPESDYLYDPEYFTDRPQRFFVSEIIRAQILEQFSKEIPYSCEVRVDRFKEKTTHKDAKPYIAIDAVVMVSRDSQKGILIGTRGRGIRDLGTAARERIEEFLGAKVHLALRVKVAKDWRSDDLKLRQLGYPS
jgi:GTP-binding protein Era